MPVTGNDIVNTVQIDAGGYMVTAGVTEGSVPPVAFIAGRGDSRAIWAPVLQRLRSGSATLTYDRAGIGDSDKFPFPGPLTYSSHARELAMLLHSGPLDGPFVVVAHSMGALIARSLAASNSGLMAGLVLIDGSVDELELWPSDRPATDGSGPLATLLDFPAGAAELATAPDPSAPAVVITRTPGRWPDPKATAAVDERWTRHQQNMARRLNAPLLAARDSGHYVHHEAAGLVAYAVDEVVLAVRAGLPSPSLNAVKVFEMGGQIAAPAR